MNMNYIKLANEAMRNKKYDVAYKLYQEMLSLDIPRQIKKSIGLNIEICRARMTDYEGYKSLIANENNVEKPLTSIENVSGLELIEYNQLVTSVVDWGDMLVNSNTLEGDIDKILFYIRNWNKSSIVIKDFFDNDFYLESYKDIKESGINPLLHFLNHGIKEGRVGKFGVNNFSMGAVPIDKNKKNIIFVTHESSATGAPLLGLNLVKLYLKKFNVINIILKNSNIHSDFISNACLTYSNLGDNSYVSAKYLLKELLSKLKIEFMIANSIESSPVITAAYEAGIPNICLIHEFSEYTRPVGKITKAVMESDLIIVPATIVYDSVIKEMTSLSHLNSKANNIIVNKQGKLKFFPKSKSGKSINFSSHTPLKVNKIIGNPQIIVTGAGWVQQRKGVDLFIQLAATIRNKIEIDIKFIWVGGGYDPLNDVTYSIYIEKLINEHELNEYLIMLDHQDDLQNVWDVTDIFVLSSRFDPFPNVAVDAMDNNIPIACFENASGTYEFLLENNGDAIFAKYLDVNEMADGIVSRINSGLKKSNVNRELVQEKLNFDKYAGDLLSNALQAVKSRRINNEIIDEIIKFISENKDKNLNFEERYEIKKYVDLGMKGLHFKNPVPGFSDIKWIHDNEALMKCVPFYEAIKIGQKSTHEIVDINSISFTAHEILPKYAVHIHIHYENTLEYFYPYIKSLPKPYDIYITTTLSSLDHEVNKINEISGGQFLSIIYTENIGRDIGPLIFNLNDRIDMGKYDVVGHFHGKKSVHMGRDQSFLWMKYLLDNLIGEADYVRKILHSFSDNVGLIFVDEQNAMDIGMNENKVLNLCEILKIKKITQTPVFPVGNMFWARPAAIQQLFLLNRDLILRAEPLPNDGTFLHAIERITPHLVDSNGYKSIIVKPNSLRTNYAVGYW